MLIYGRRRQKRKLGHVAEVCPYCRKVCIVKVSRSALIDHLFFIPIRPPFLPEYIGKCWTCRGQFRVEPTDYASFQKRGDIRFGELSKKTNPKLVANNEQAVRDHRRMVAIRTPLLRFNDDLEDRYAIAGKYDWASIGAIFAVFLVPTGVVIALNAMFPEGWKGWPVVMAFLLCLLGAIRVVRTEPRRFFRRKLLPLIIEHLRQIDPTKEELAACIAAMRRFRYRIYRFLDADTLSESLTAAGERRARPNAAAAKERQTPMADATVVDQDDGLPPDAINKLNIRAGTFTDLGLIDTTRVWETADGDRLGIQFLAMPPDLPKNQPSVEAFAESYRAFAGDNLLEVTLRESAGFQIVRSIARVPQSPSGMTYLGAFIIPFQDFSYIVNIQCEEWGTTGLREAILLDRGLSSGKNVIGDNGQIAGEWNPDAEIHDAEFPDHPISRCRRGLKQIGSSLSMSAELKKYPVLEVVTKSSDAG